MCTLEYYIVLATAMNNDYRIELTGSEFVVVNSCPLSVITVRTPARNCNALT